MTQHDGERMTKQPSDHSAASDTARAESSSDSGKANVKAKAAPCWPFPAGSQNDTEKAVKLKPYVPPKRRTLNQY